METNVLTFYVNGKKVVESLPDPRETLAHYLRSKLGLKGTKIGCNEGGCGACTVMVSERTLSGGKIRFDFLAAAKSPEAAKTAANFRHYSANACLFPVCGVHGKAITTVEGIGSTRHRLHPVQERLSRAHGSQCGFCTPGFVMAMYALLRNNPQPSIQEIDEALQGNLCRCTGYRPILESFYSFSKGGCSSPVNGVCCQENNETESIERPNEALRLVDFEGIAPYDPSQEPIFPPELQTENFNSQSLIFRHTHCTWYRPTSLKKLLMLKYKFPHARIVSGNSEIGIEQRFKQVEYSVLIDPRGVPELFETKAEADKGLYIGAGFSLSEMKNIILDHTKAIPKDNAKVFKAVAEMLRWFAGKHIRNTATVAGNIATASPISDLNPLWLAAGATVVLAENEDQTKELLMDDTFFIKYRVTKINPSEIILGLWIPYTAENEHFFGYKQAQRREDDIAIANAGIKVTLCPGTSTIQDIRLSFGGMAPKTVMALKTMDNLRGSNWDKEVMERAIPLLLEDLPLSPGVPGGMERFRQTLCLSFFFKFFLSVQTHLENPGSLKESNETQITDHRAMEATQIFQEVASGQPAIDLVHRPLMHLSGEKHTTGEASYCDDIDVSKALYLQCALSERAKAKIIDIDTSEALAMHGVVEIVDYRDIPCNGRLEIGIGNDTPVFACDEVMHYGQPILGVLAEDDEQAKRAARKIKVTYEEQDPIITIETAIEKGSIYPPGTWTLSNVRNEDRTIQDIDWSRCDGVVEGEVRVGGQEHFYLETQSVIAIPGEDDTMELISSTQSVTEVQEGVSNVLGIPMHKIVVSVKRIGGGFGGKQSASPMAAARAAVAAQKVRRPVKHVLERFDDMALTGTRQPFLGRCKVGFSMDGKILAYDVNLSSNAGSTMDVSLGVLYRAMFTADNAYSVPQMTVKGQIYKTNIQSCTAFRGFGTPESQLITEEMMDKVAETLNIPPEKVREKNLYKDGDRTHWGQQLSQCNQRRCWDECMKLSVFNMRKQEIENFNRQNQWKKRGIAIIPTKYNIAYGRFALNQGGALVHIYTDGSVLVNHSGMEMGQGLHTKMLQIASATLRIPCERIHINNTASDKVPNTSPTAGSMGSDINGFAVQRACEILLHRLAPYMFEKPKDSWEEWVKAAYEDRVSLSATGFYKVTGIEPYNWERGEGKMYHYFVYGAACSEVEVDCLTGDHKLLRTDIVMDIGDSLNPAVDIGQIEGAFVQGYGLYTMEELKCSPKGVWYTRGPGTYKIPTADDIPRQFHVKLLSGSSNKTNIFSSKAVGEPPVMLGSSAFFAIKEAIKSARKASGFSTMFSMDSPATSERIRMLCQDQFTEKVPKLPDPILYQAWTVPL